MTKEEIKSENLSVFVPLKESRKLAAKIETAKNIILESTNLKEISKAREYLCTIAFTYSENTILDLRNK